MRLSVIDIARSDLPPALLSKMIVDFDELQDAREIAPRYRPAQSGGAQVDPCGGSGGFYRSFRSPSSIVHRIRAPGVRRSQSLPLAACLGIWLVALHASPYGGSVSITPGTIGRSVLRLTSGRVRLRRGYRDENARRPVMDEDRFNMEMRNVFLKEVGVTSQREIERLVREGKVEGGELRLRMTRRRKKR